MVSHNEKMVAPCGMNCTYCYVHHKKKKPCMGCREESDNKPISCRKCKIKACVISKNLSFCNDCDVFPCILIKRLDKSYQKKYQESLIKNLKTIKERGMESFLSLDKDRLKCPNCEGVVNIHDKICSLCGGKFEIESRR